MILTPDQEIVHDAIVAYAKNPTKPFITIGGYAGVGKTTVTAQTVRTLRANGHKSIGFCCFTGKAASVLRQKLMVAGVLGDSYCGTIHSLIYRPIADQQGRIKRFDRVSSIDEKLLIVDEASMVNQDIWQDLLSYRVPIIAVGDHGQLPPINKPGAAAFNLMETPQLKLEKIHRQAEDNPIIKLATLARLDGKIPHGRTGYGIGCYYLKNAQVIESAIKYGRLRTTLFLCGINRSRIILNKAIRAALGYTQNSPQVGEKVICLKNNREAHVYNGVTGTIASCTEFSALLYDMTVRMDDGVEFDGLVLRDQFNAETTMREHPAIKPGQMKDVNLFDFGYALTVHKAQGSEAETVVLFMERMRYMSDEDWRRWLYTGITRARKFLTCVNRLYAPKSAESEAMDAQYAAAMAADN